MVYRSDYIRVTPRPTLESLVGAVGLVADGTGVVGATIRMYLETYVDPSGAHGDFAPEKVKALAEVALQISQLKEITGRKEPT
eukprot:7841133-Pyramimonas_sp.AAC.1